MKRSVGAELEITAEDECELELQIAVAKAPGLKVKEQLLIVNDQQGPVVPTELVQPHHGRMHVVTLPAGKSRITYEATVKGRAKTPEVDATDLSVFRRPSRYATADTFGDFAISEFGSVRDGDLLDAVSSWVGTRLSYVPGSSGPTDGATETLELKKGVCRDYAHLVIAILRALNVPARLVAVYAPGCDPMDFHAVVEAYVADGWHVVDATALAPRSSLVRITTGRDAADTAFMSTVRGAATLESSTVTAVVDGPFPGDDVDQLVQIS